MAIHIKFRYNSDIIQIQFNCKFNSNSDTILQYKNPNFQDISKSKESMSEPII